MKTIKSILMLVIFLGILTMFSCTKEGKQGDAGTNGANGNANVVSSSLWIGTNQWWYSAPSYIMDISYAPITQDIIDNGAVLVYYSANNGVGYEQLPTTLYLSSSYSTTINSVASVGKVRLVYTDSDLTQPVSLFTMKIKVVVISSSARLAHPNIDYTNYYEVKGAFNLEDFKTNNLNVNIMRFTCLILQFI